MLFDLTPLTAQFGSLELGILICLVLGFFVGIISGMLGIGGGFIITPFFHAGLGLSASHAVASSMGQMPLMATFACWEYFKKNLISFKTALFFLITAIPSAQYVAHWVAKIQNSEFGSKPVWNGLSSADVIILISFTFIIGTIGLYNIYRSYGLKADDSNLKPMFKGNGLNIVSLISGIIFGIVSVILGIGGGFLAVPFFIYVHGLKPINAVATSMFCIFITSSITSLHYLWLGEIYFGLSLVLALSSIIGAILGTKIAIKLSPDILLKSFAILQLGVVVIYTYIKL